MLRGPSRLVGWATGGLAAGAVIAAAAVPGMAGARPAPDTPLQIQSASLAQQGQQLVWQIQLAQPFSPGGLAQDHRTLCLLLSGARPAGASAQLCVAGPARRSTTPRILYSPISRGGVVGRARAVAATITRASDSALAAAFLPSDVGIGYAPLRWQVISAVLPPACGASTGCSTAFPSNPPLLLLHTPRVVGCAPNGPSLVYSGPAHTRQIALTFDDGPSYTPPPSAFLSVLERDHVPATFFEIGEQIATYDHGGAYERRMLADGDMIGDHTWSHPDVTRLSPAEQRAQLLGTAAAIRKAAGGFTPCLWRPPYGSVSPSIVSLARSLGFITVMWDVDPRDWTTPGVPAIYGNVIANARDGAIVLQHFGGGPRYETVAALSQEIPTLRHEGYTFVTVTEMLGLRLLYR